ncbi:MAG: ImmA/IrrE family metallo-endopeptidase [Limnochordales bacterium]
MARRLNMSRPTISQIEAGKRPVNGLELIRFAKLYRVSVASLLDDEQDPTARAEGVYFPGLEEPVADGPGRTPDLRPAVRAALQAFVVHCRDYAYLERLVGAHPKGLTVRYVPEELSDDPEEQGELAAAQERNRLGLGQAPVLCLPELLERQSVKVFVASRPDAPHLSAATLYRRDFGHALFVNVANALFPPTWLNFTAAHAYAHLLFDKDSDIVDYNNFLADRRPAERRANAFALAFLMPRELVEAELRAIGWRGHDAVGESELVYLALRMGVTFTALLQRLHRLGYLSDDARQELLERQHAAGRWEELDWALAMRDAHEEWTVYRQRGRFRLLAAQAYRRGLLPLDQAAQLTEMPPEVFRRFAERGLPNQPPAPCSALSALEE